MSERIQKLGLQQLTEIDRSRRHEECEFLGSHVEGEVDAFTRGVVRVVLNCHGALEGAQHPSIVPFHLQVLEPSLQPQTKMFFRCINYQLVNYFQLADSYPEMDNTKKFIGKQQKFCNAFALMRLIAV